MPDGVRQHFDRLGFSLIELLIVISIIASVSALVGPSLFKQVAKVQIQSDQRKLVQVLQHLSHNAFLSGQSINVELSDNIGAYFYTRKPESVKSKKFDYIRFPPQQLTLNANGFVTPTSVQFSAETGSQVLSLQIINTL